MCDPFLTPGWGSAVRVQGALPVLYGCGKGCPHLCFHHGRGSQGFHLPHVLVRTQRCQSERGCAGCLHGEFWLKTLEMKQLSDSFFNIHIYAYFFSSQSSATRNAWMPVHPAWPPACQPHLPTLWPDGWRRGCRACWAALKATGQALSPLELDLHSINHQVHPPSPRQPSLTVPP